MASTFTPNKNLELPANGDDVGTWDVPMNADLTNIDKAMGDTAVINVVAASGTVTLTLAQYRPPSIRFTGLLTANVNYQLPTNVGGVWSMFDNTTGNFTVTVSSAGGGASVVLPQGLSALIVSDGTNVRFGNDPVPDYTVGTWTPTISFQTPGTSSFSYSTQVGRYTRFADLAYLEFQASFTPTRGTGSGLVKINGLPFSAADANAPIGAVGSLSVGAWPGSAPFLTANAANTLRVLFNASGVGAVQLIAAELNDGVPNTINGNIWLKV